MDINVQILIAVIIVLEYWLGYIIGYIVKGKTTVKLDKDQYLITYREKLSRNETIYGADMCIYHAQGFIQASYIFGAIGEKEYKEAIDAIKSEYRRHIKENNL